MKKCLLLLAALVFMLCSCSKNEPQKIITSDMLNITNTEENLFGCINRYNAVISAMSSKVNVVETEHNRLIKHGENPEYFLEDDYILTSFNPFVMQTSGVAEKITAELDSKNAETVFELDANGADIIYETDGKTIYTVSFVSEEISKEYSYEYNKDVDGFRYTYTVEESESGENIEEFLEFITLDNNTYVIQNQDTRCSISFDDEGRIVTFCCAQLNGESFFDEESILTSSPETPDKHWVVARGKLKYKNIHTYENDILTHEDGSSGPWKAVEIEARKYESAFYR